MKSKQLIQHALRHYNNSVYAWAQSAGEYATWISWGQGAYFILNVKLNSAIDEMIPGGEKEANLLFELGMQPIVTDWFFQLDRHGNRSQEENEAATEIVRRNIQGFLFGYELEENINLYGCFHIQYSESLRHLFNGAKDTMSLLYCEFVEHRWMECCTGKQIIDWQNINFPCLDYNEFVNARLPAMTKLWVNLMNPYNTAALYQTINRAFKSAVNFREKAFELVRNLDKGSWYRFNYEEE
ncbi:MAG: hypothetical protein U1B77_00630 [Dehalococcoidales bacterium]|nr:hypothetical protein [Dehalococcoidales bacterium]